MGNEAASTAGHDSGDRGSDSSERTGEGRNPSKFRGTANTSQPQNLVWAGVIVSIGLDSTLQQGQSYMLSIVLERRIEMLQILNKLVGFLDEV
jgi:hypothetical protein